MASQKLAPLYLQVRRSSLESTGVIITDPYDPLQVVPYVTGFINNTSNQYFMPVAIEAVHKEHIPNPHCPAGQYIEVSYNVEHLVVGGSALYAPILFNASGLLAGEREFTGLQQDFGCFKVGTAPIDPKKFKIEFQAYSVEDPNVSGNYLIVNLMTDINPPPVVSIPLSSPPGYDAVEFVADNHSEPAATVNGYFIFRVIPLAEIIQKP